MSHETENSHENKYASIEWGGYFMEYRKNNALAGELFEEVLPTDPNLQRPAFSRMFTATGHYGCQYFFPRQDSSVAIGFKKDSPLGISLYSPQQTPLLHANFDMQDGNITELEIFEETIVDKDGFMLQRPDKSSVVDLGGRHVSHIPTDPRFIVKRKILHDDKKIAYRCFGSETIVYAGNNHLGVQVNRPSGTKDFFRIPNMLNPQIANIVLDEDSLTWASELVTHDLTRFVHSKTKQ